MLFMNIVTIHTAGTNDFSAVGAVERKRNIVIKTSLRFPPFC